MSGQDHDTVNHPPHYTRGTMEVIDAIEGLGLGFHEGNVLKYIARWQHKHDDPEKQIADLRKAAWYVGRLIQRATRETFQEAVDANRSG